jgi:integrase
MADRTGITERHGRSCASKGGARCNCGFTRDQGPYQAWYYDKRALNANGTKGRKVRRTFSGPGSLSAAKIWRTDATREVRLKQLRAPTKKTVREAVEEFLRGAEVGEIRNKRKEPYKPSVIRQYRSALEKRFLPEFGDWRISDVENADLIVLKERLQGEGISDSTVRNVFVPVQAIFRRAKRMRDIAINPAEDLDLPAGGTGRERAATPSQAAELIEALPEEDQALWATAFYAGLRRGELRALRVADINETCIHVEYGWDDREGQQAPKSLSGRRDVPLTKTLRAFLTAHLERTGRIGEDLVFGRDAALPFTPHHISDRADKAWNEVNEKRAEDELPPLERYTLHEARHSFSTWLDATGISEERSDRYMGHSRGGVASRYRHLLPGQLADDARKIDEYLAGAVAGKITSIRAAS